MKLYLAMCSLSLAAGAALGQLNGKYLAAAQFVDNCDDRRLVIFHDREADEQRHFHCFEIELEASERKPSPLPRAHTAVI